MRSLCPLHRQRLKIQGLRDGPHILYDIKSIPQLSRTDERQRIFKYADRLSICLYTIGVICMAASGTALPILDLIFGQFVNTFNDFAQDAASVSHFRSQIAQARYGSHDACKPTMNLTCLVFIWSTLQSRNWLFSMLELRVPLQDDLCRSVTNLVAR